LPSSRWRNLAASGALPQRLLWASTGTKDPAAPDVLYVEALAAPETINTMPEKTLLAFADHGKVKDAMRFDGGMPKRYSRNLRARASTTKRLPPTPSAKAPPPSPSHGVI
jgi:transaldolase